MKVGYIHKLWDSDLFDATKCSKENLFTKIENLALFMQFIAADLKNMHASNIIHCDIKPENLVMDYDKDKDVPIQFGMIDFDSAINDMKRYPHQGSTPGFVAPELTLKYQNKELTNKCDIFSLGISIIDMISSVGYRNLIASKSKEDPYLSEEEIDGFINDCDLLKKQEHKELKDLLTKMTLVSVEERYDINDVMKHPWFQKNCCEQKDKTD